VLARGYRPRELWADRGYRSDDLREQIAEREVSPQISRRKRSNEPESPDQPKRTGTRGRKKVIRRADPNARQRWVVERTNAWLRRFRRLTIRTEPNSRVYLAYLTLAIVLILPRDL
jgi:IS5 family transposase